MLSVFFVAGTIVQTLVAPQSSISELVLRPGASIESEIVAESADVHAPKLDQRRDVHPVCSKSVTVRVETPGTYTIDARSWDFDPYLILRGADGGVLAEDDDGWMNRHARIVRELEAGRAYIVDVVGTRRGVGSFSLLLRPGVSSLPDWDEQRADLQAAIAALQRDLDQNAPGNTILAWRAQRVGRVCLALGLFSEGEQWHRRALAIQEQVLGLDHADTARSVHNVGFALERQARYAEAEEWYRRAVAIREKVLGPDHADTALSVNNVGAALEHLGRYAEAEEWYRRSLAIREKVLGPEDADTAWSVHTVGAALEHQGRYVEAEEWFRRSLAIRERVLGLESADTAWSVNSIGTALHFQGRFAEAEVWFRRALAIREKVLGLENTDTALSMTNVGASLDRQGRYAESDEWTLRALAIQEKVLGPEHADTARSVNNVGVSLDRQGRYAESEQWYRRALAIREKVFGLEHAETAWSVNNIGLALERQGRYVESEEWCRRALAIRENVLGPEHADTAWSVNSVGVALDRQGRYAEAEEWYRRALAIREKALGPEHAETAMSVNCVGAVLGLQGRFAESEEWYRRALAICEKVLGPEHAESAMSLHFVGVALDGQGRYAESEECYRRALAIQEKVLGEENADTAWSVNNIGISLSCQGRYAEAEEWYRRALAIREKVLGPGHADTAASVNSVGAALARQGRYADAEEWHRRALAIYEAALGSEHANTAASMTNVGTDLEQQRRFAEAEEWHRRALAVFEKVLGPEHPETSWSVNSVGVDLERQGHYAESEEWYRRALAVRETVLGPEHPNTSESREVLTRVSAREGRLDAAQEESRTALINRLKQAWRETVCTPSDLRLLGLGPLRSTLFQSSTLEIANAPVNLNDAYARLTAWKGLVFRAERLSQATPQRDSEVIAPLRRRARDLTSQLSLLAYSKAVRDPEEQRAQFERLQEERRSVERQLFQSLGIQSEREQTNAAELARVLPPKAAIIDLIEFTPHRFAGPDDPPTDDGEWLPARMNAWITRHGDTQPVLVDLGPSSELKPLVEEALAELAPALRGVQVSRGVSPPTSAAVTRSAAARLREALWRPLQPNLDGVTHLFVCPDSYLAELPLDALALSDGTLLIEEIDVTYAQDPVSLRNLLESEPSEREGSLSLLAIGDVDYRARAEWKHEPLAEGGATNPARGTRSFSQRFEPLPDTKLEANGVADLVRSLDRSGDESVKLLVRSEATEEAFKSFAPSKRLLHLATHGFYQREGLSSLWAAAMEASMQQANEPLGIGAQLGGGGARAMPAITADTVSSGLLTGLALAGVNAPAAEGRDDGVLTADEVARLDLSGCDLAVLSACETALGQANSGEGLISLRRAFLQAGAKTVVSTLWRVDDRATRELMGEFYRRLLIDKQPPGAALRGAKLHLLKNTEFKEPKYWAAFTLAGDWR